MARVNSGRCIHTSQAFSVESKIHNAARASRCRPALRVTMIKCFMIINNHGEAPAACCVACHSLLPCWHVTLPAHAVTMTGKPRLTKFYEYLVRVAAYAHALGGNSRSSIPQCFS